MERYPRPDAMASGGMKVDRMARLVIEYEVALLEAWYEFFGDQK